MVGTVPKNNASSTTPSKESPVQVYVRLRPLIKEEQDHEVIDYKIERATSRARIQLKMPAEPPSQSAVNPAFASAPPLRRRGSTFKTFDGFTNILEAEVNNVWTYEACVEPLVDQIVANTNQSACVFTYGHTGSGKSHTLLGYGEELGIYKFAAADLVEKLQDQNPDLCILARVTELYKDQVQDLITNRPCSIRQDGKGVVRVRGPMLEDEEGRVDQQPLGRICQTSDEVVECVEAACAARRVGISTHHSQSSRSHLVLEMEIVTPELVEQRNLLAKQDAHLTRLKWLQTERMRGKSAPPKWTLGYNPQKIRKEIQEYEKLVRASRQKMKKLAPKLGGTLVFCDLAGNEYARDAANSSDEELEEAAQINKSLLAVKETIRSLSQTTTVGKHRHVPYRGSKLTMILARHLQSRAIMLAHLSPSQESFQKTINTLNYSSLVGHTPKKGKENKP